MSISEILNYIYNNFGILAFITIITLPTIQDYLVNSNFINNKDYINGMFTSIYIYLLSYLFYLYLLLVL